MFLFVRTNSKGRWWGFRGEDYPGNDRPPFFSPHHQKKEKKKPVYREKPLGTLSSRKKKREERRKRGRDKEKPRKTS